MDTLDHYFPNSKGKEFGKKYIVLSSPEKPQTRHYLSLKCKDCGYEFTQRANSVFMGVISCKCSKSYRKTKEEFREQVYAECQKRGVEVVSLECVRPLSDSRGTFRCLDCEGIWSTSTSSILSNGTGCLHCVGLYKPTNEEYIDKITSRLSNNFELVNVDYTVKINKNSKVHVKCMSCQSVSTKRVAAVLYHTPSCPSCADWGFDPSVKNFMYLIKLSNSESVFYKVGITCDLERRTRELSRNNKMDVEVLYSWEYHPSSLILEHEQKLKQYFSIGRQQGKPLKDGYTEVVLEESLPVLVAVQKLQYMEANSGFSY